MHSTLYTVIIIIILRTRRTAYATGHTHKARTRAPAIAPVRSPAVVFCGRGTTGARGVDGTLCFASTLADGTTRAPPNVCACAIRVTPPPPPPTTADEAAADNKCFLTVRICTSVDRICQWPIRDSRCDSSSAPGDRVGTGFAPARRISFILQIVCKKNSFFVASDHQIGEGGLKPPLSRTPSPVRPILLAHQPKITRIFTY